MIDNGDPGFSTTGTWSTNSNGLGGSALDAEPAWSSNPSATASWTFTGLEPGAFYEVAATWQPMGYNQARFNLVDGSRLAGGVTIDQGNTPSDFTADGAAWNRLGTFFVSGDRLTVTLSNDYAYGRIHADAIRLVKIEGDRAQGRSFRRRCLFPHDRRRRPALFERG